MALSSNRELDRYVDQELRALPVKASTHIYKGALVGIHAATGCVRGLVAGDSFAGVAYEEADNSAGADAAICVRVYTQGDFEHPFTSAARTNNGAAIYASDDATLTLTATNNSAVGRQIEAPTSGKIVLRIKSVFGQ
ncbi:MAG TPA: DUF2190 family protein [Phycisphaerae bacterium]|nr:DUF2190 family protein [Phycisphaerae bacterium]HOJ75295.1 DUF2190 family protein [Phycisphaerae bacterium]HOM53040.1 DUF2190 family protein [Phycisphaerae bacterium]HOQ87369.1 DUF2190 family protein [Phycisphaerae bacterium]HPP28203.1 DUF2190 family protein [Phycisphaerae bacterium]